MPRFWGAIKSDRAQLVSRENDHSFIISFGDRYDRHTYQIRVSQVWRSGYKYKVEFGQTPKSKVMETFEDANVFYIGDFQELTQILSGAKLAKEAGVDYHIAFNGESVVTNQPAIVLPTPEETKVYTKPNLAYTERQHYEALRKVMVGLDRHRKALTALVAADEEGYAQAEANEVTARVFYVEALEELETFEHESVESITMPTLFEKGKEVSYA